MNKRLTSDGKNVCENIFFTDISKTDNSFNKY